MSSPGKPGSSSPLATHSSDEGTVMRIRAVEALRFE